MHGGGGSREFFGGSCLHCLDVLASGGRQHVFVPEPDRMRWMAYRGFERVQCSPSDSFKCQDYRKARRAPGVKCLGEFFIFLFGVRVYIFIPQPLTL